MPTFDEAVAQLRGPEAGGFGFSELQAGKLINRGVRELASRSEWIRAVLDLGPAVADQADYELPENVVKVKRLRMGSAPYSRQNIETLWDLEAGRERLVGEGGVFIPNFDESGNDRLVTLFPTPGSSDAGTPIRVLAAIYPAADLAGADKLPFPEDGWEGALHFAKAIAYEDVDENPAQATYFRNLFTTAAEELRQKANSQVGQGPVRFPVAGRS